MALIRSTNNSTSRYTQGGLTDVFQTRLGWWERYSIPQDPGTDIPFTIESQHDGRPDIIAYEFWGNPKLAWLVLQYNTIIDPSTELVKGKTIKLPPESRVIGEILIQSLGGNNRIRIT